MLISFHSSHYPTKPTDTPKKSEPAKHNHVVFVCKNKFFKVLLADQNSELSAAELEVQIEMVIQLVGTKKACQCQSYSPFLSGCVDDTNTACGHGNGIGAHVNPACPKLTQRVCEIFHCCVHHRSIMLLLLHYHIVASFPSPCQALLCHHIMLSPWWPHCCK